MCCLFFPFSSMSSFFYDDLNYLYKSIKAEGFPTCSQEDGTEKDFTGLCSHWRGRNWYMIQAMWSVFNFWKMQQNKFSTGASRKVHTPFNSLILSQWNPHQILTYRTGDNKYVLLYTLSVVIDYCGNKKLIWYIQSKSSLSL